MLKVNLIFFILLAFVLECIPQEAEARGRRAFGRRVARQGAVRRVNRNRGVVRRNNAGRVRVVRNDDIFGLDLQPVDAFSSLVLNPFGNLSAINGFSNIVTDGRGRFFVVDNTLNNGGVITNPVLQAELLQSGGSFFGAVNPFTGTFNPAISSQAFNQIQFLNTLGSLNTSCFNRICNFR